MALETLGLIAIGVLLGIFAVMAHNAARTATRRARRRSVSSTPRRRSRRRTTAHTRAGED